MNNPKVEGNYTTIFKDGSVVLENYWIIFPDGHGKWYWDEDIRGGVVAWSNIPEGGYIRHPFYKLPDWEMDDIIRLITGYEVLMDSGVKTWDGYKDAWTLYEDRLKKEKEYYSKYLIRDERGDLY